MPETQYTAEYFESLGFTKEEARVFAKNWKKKGSQTMEEVEKGIRWEREGRERLSELNMQKNSAKKETGGERKG